MSKEISEIRHYLGDTTVLLDEDDCGELPEDETIIQNTFEQEVHIRIIECLFEISEKIKNKGYEILEKFGYSELYDFLSDS